MASMHCGMIIYIGDLRKHAAATPKRPLRESWSPCPWDWDELIPKRFLSQK